MTAPAPSTPATATRRPRLLVVGPVPPPIGGVETCTQAVLESPALRDFEVAHCDITKGRAKETQGRFDLLNFAWAARHLLRMARAVASFRPDLVYLQVSGSRSGVLRDLALGWIARIAGARVVMHQHAGGIDEVLGDRGPLGRIVRAGFNRAERVLVLGEHWRALFERHVRPPVAVVPSTLRREVLERAAALRRTERDPAPVRGLFVGQVGRAKGTPDLLRALRRVRDRGVPFAMAFVGPPQQPGDEAAALALRAELGLEDSVEFTGPLLGEVLYERFRAADLFLLPSHREGLPVVLYEAGAFGLPVITTPVGAIPDLVRDGENGLLVAPGDVEALAAAVERLARNHAERRRMGARLRQDVAAFHPDAVCARIAAHLGEALPAPRRTR